MSEWSRTGEGDAPAADVDRRTTILRALNVARNAASAARTAEAGLNAEYLREHAKLKGIESHANAAIARHTDRGSAAGARRTGRTDASTRGGRRKP